MANSREASEVIVSYDLNNSAFWQYSEFTGSVTDVALQLKRYIEVGPVVTQFNPNQLAMVASIHTKEGRQVQIFQPKAFLN